MENTEIKPKVSTNLFSKLSIVFSILTLTLIIVLVNFVIETIKAKKILQAAPSPLVIGTYVSCLLGVIFSILSLIKKEKLRYWKAISATLNIILFLFIIGTILFGLYKDLKREHKSVLQNPKYHVLKEQRIA